MVLHRIYRNKMDIEEFGRSKEYDGQPLIQFRSKKSPICVEQGVAGPTSYQPC
jgi:hypothetical protein